MRERALVHVAGPAGAGKTAFVEALIPDLGDRGALVPAARCVRDHRLRAPRETAPKAHPELRRYLEAGATGAALFAFPEEDDATDAFFMTHLMEDYSEAVALEGDNPVAFVDLPVFVAPPPAPGRTLFVRRRRDRAKEERRKAEALLRLLRKPGGPVADLARANPRIFEEACLGLLAARKAPPPPPTEHWALAEELVADVVANLADPEDGGRRKALARVRRALDRHH